jgi:hypothetical protein
LDKSEQSAAPAVQTEAIKAADFPVVQQARRAAAAKFDHYHEVMGAAATETLQAQSAAAAKEKS